jgi:hypothetical protein
VPSKVRPNPGFLAAEVQSRHVAIGGWNLCRETAGDGTLDEAVKSPALTGCAAASRTEPRHLRFDLGSEVPYNSTAREEVMLAAPPDIHIQLWHTGVKIPYFPAQAEGLENFHV